MNTLRFHCQPCPISESAAVAARMTAEGFTVLSVSVYVIPIQQGNLTIPSINCLVTGHIDALQIHTPIEREFREREEMMKSARIIRPGLN